MGRRAIIQIGTEKTGTTTLQHFLAANRGRLAEKGFLYPRFCGEVNHTGLAAYALDPTKSDAIRAAHTPEEAAQLRGRLARAAALELAGEQTVLFCSEHCHSRLNSPGEVAALRDFLRGFFDDIRIAVYLRRQDQVALSLYSTRLKSGATDRTILPAASAEDPYFNYARSLALWSDAFGRENLRVGLFDRRTLVGGSVVDDFLAVWSLGPASDYTPIPDQNESIVPVAQEYLRRVNEHLKPLAGLPMDEVRGPLAAALARHFPGRGGRPSRAAAERFYAKYRASNEAVRASYFPERAALFDEDFSAYPETDDLVDGTADALAAVAAGLHTASVRETRRLEAEIAVRDAQLAWSRNEAARAFEALDRARRWCPDHPGAWRTRAEYLLRLDRLDEAIAAANRAIDISGTAFEYWHFLGILHRRAGNLPDAADAQRRALSLNAGHAASARELEQIDAALSRADAAARPSTTSSETDPWPKPLSA